VAALTTVSSTSAFDPCREFRTSSIAADAGHRP
jgi:hypothetical protein